MEKEELRVLILSAGKIDNELAKIFGEIPSGLIPLNGKPGIFRIIDKLIDEGFEKFWIAAPNIKIRQAAKLFNLNHLKCRTDEIGKTIQKIEQNKGINIIEVMFLIKLNDD